MGGEASARESLWLRLVKALAHVRTDVPFAVIDAFLVVMAYMTALMLRFFDDGLVGVPPQWWEGFLKLLPVIVAVHLLANVAFGTYGHVWEYASVAEALRIVGAAVTAAATLLMGVLIWRVGLVHDGPIPVSVVVIGAMLTLAGMGLVRFRSRLFSFNRLTRGAAPRHRTLIVGTGRAAANLARYGSVDGQPITVVGFVSPSAGEANRRLAGLPVFGPLEAVPELVAVHDVDELVVATDDGDSLVRRLVDLCLLVDVRLRIIPDINKLLGGNGSVPDVRDLQPIDLLPRAAVTTELEQVAATLRGRRVLVTGAGGSIGAELVRQIVHFEPESVVALDHDETHLHEAMLSWSRQGGPTPPVLVLCDIRDRRSLQRVLVTHRPEVVFHAAAHKHVPILEDSPDEAVKTNVLGTVNLLETVRGVGVERFVLISTDKAADPSSVMGASKRVAEMLVQGASARGGRGVYSAVRFGNVLGSRGSVVPTFLEQIKRGGPVTVTDPEMTRYFMTVQEAVELVLQASAMAKGGEVLVLDMGEPVKIVDLAHRLIRMAGLVPGRDIEVEVVGRRPGEKLAEILSTLPLVPSDHPKISIAQPGWPGAVTLLDSVNELARLVEEGDPEAIRKTLHALAKAEWGPGNETVYLEGLDGIGLQSPNGDYAEGSGDGAVSRLRGDHRPGGVGTAAD